MYKPSIDQKALAFAELLPLFSIIEELMHEAESITKEAANEHWRAFVQQMRDKFGVDEIAFDEPYLPRTIAYSSLNFLIRLQQLTEKIERGAEDEDFRTSFFDFDEPLMPQLSGRLQLETARHKLATKQELDKIRQQTFGVKGYIWRADGESCPVCAPRDGKIFTWGEGEAPGSIHPNCQCWAEPMPDGSEIDDPPIEPVYPLETLLAVLAGTGTAWRIGREIFRRTEEQVPTRPKPQEKPETPREILNPQGKPIGTSGKRQEVRIEKGGEQAAKELYDKLSRGGVSDTPPKYQGEGTRLPNGDWVGYRPRSKSGSPTIDVDVNGVPFDKIHFP